MVSLKDKTIMVLDDDLDTREILKEILEDQVNTIFMAENGEDGLRRFEQGGIDIVISDIKMPIMDGVSFLKAIKSIDPYVPVILMTGYDKLSAMQKAWEAGAYDFIEKPLKPSNVVAAVDSAASFGRHYMEEKNQDSAEIGQDQYSLKIDLPADVLRGLTDVATDHHLGAGEMAAKIISEYLKIKKAG